MPEIKRTDVKTEKLFSIFDYLVGDLEQIREAFLNHVTVHGGLAVGTTATKFKTSATTYYILAGKHYSKAATDDIAAPATGATGASEYRKDLISIDAAGTITVTKGTVAASQAAAAKPDVPADNVELGWIEVPNSFTPGTDNVTSGMLKPVDMANRLVLDSTVEA